MDCVKWFTAKWYFTASLCFVADKMWSIRNYPPLCPLSIKQNKKKWCLKLLELFNFLNYKKKENETNYHINYVKTWKMIE